ncbi:MAG: DUF2666 family protein [Candidatus Bilamarchaeaceae archaeon]
MLGDEELIFSGTYKDFSLGVRFDLSNAKPQDVASALIYISEKIEGAGYKFCGINYNSIENVVEKFNSVEQLCDYLKKGDFKKALDAAVEDKKLIPAAESYFFNLLLRRNNIPIKPSFQLTLKPYSYNEQGRIVFVGKYGDWVAIKKLSLSDVEFDWEVAGLIASVNMTAVKKAFQFGTKNYIQIEEEAKKLVQKKRKSFAAAAEIIHTTIDNPVLLTLALEELGYYTYLSLFALMEAYPDLKPKKPKGRMPSK